MQSGVSSLSLAVYEHHTEIAMLLVHRGADVNMVEEVMAYYIIQKQSNWYVIFIL